MLITFLQVQADSLAQAPVQAAQNNPLTNEISVLEFIFKGGTSLILLMKEPKRFSVDIDIIISPKISREELEKYLSEIEKTSAFERMELDERRSYQGDIPKAHYKFIYHSNLANKNQQGEVISNPEREILLDILFTENHYPTLIEIPLYSFSSCVRVVFFA